MSSLLALLLLAAPAKDAPAPTYSRDVAPIFFKHCASCHRPKDIAPFSILDYKSARPWAKAIRQAVASRNMPPWFADPQYGHFSNDARLSDAEITTVKAWVDAGAAEGNPADLPPAPKLIDGWYAGKPDVVIDIGETYEVTPGEDAYEHFIVPTNFKEGIWVRAAEFKPDNRQVVHHAHVHIVPAEPGAKKASPIAPYTIYEGKLSRIREDAPVVNDACAENLPNLPFLTGFQEGSFASFLPGRPPDVFPEGTAKWIPPGAKLEFVIHYANMKEKGHRDRSSVGLYLSPEPPKQTLRRLDLRNFFMQIPAGAPNHEVRRCYTFERDKNLISFTPHFHYRGKDARYEVVRPNGKRETLLFVPNYDFNWQIVYRLAKPVFIEKGSRMIVTVHYDNSPNNKGNPDPAKTLRWGDRSEEEMMTSWIEYLDAN